MFTFVKYSLLKSDFTFVVLPIPIKPPSLDITFFSFNSLDVPIA
jgi:hypothetical protein